MYVIFTIALFTASVSLFWELLLQPGMLLGGMKERVADHWLKRNKVKLTLRKELEPEDRIEEKYFHVRAWWWKPTLGCILCYNVWISIFILVAGDLGLMDCLFVIVLSSLIVRLVKQYLDG